jgi:hypothetical protein
MKNQLAAALALSAAIILVCGGTTRALAAAAQPSDHPTAAEAPFVAKATADLQRLYGTTALAGAAGYFRYTDEDSTGAISWVNPKYFNSDETHPSQLWYDVKGRLIGVDYSVIRNGSKNPPSKWGLLPARWFDFGAHVHYGLTMAVGGTHFGYVTVKKMMAAGGSATNPTAADIVKAGKAKSASDVTFAFGFPDLWDTEFWTVPNPSGAFATKNPAVKPSPNAAKQM